MIEPKHDVARKSDDKYVPRREFVPVKVVARVGELVGQRGVRTDLFDCESAEVALRSDDASALMNDGCQSRIADMR